jgi:mono/diheme cytochrome c family protein
MRRLLLLAVLVPSLAGCGWSSFLQGTRTSTHKGHIVVVQQPRVGPKVSRWMKDETLPAKARPGARVFATVGCTACHTYDGSGGSNLGAPDLTTIGVHHLGIRLQVNHLKCPACVNPGSPMPSFPLGKKRLHQLAVFLEASKGTH